MNDSAGIASSLAVAVPPVAWIYWRLGQILQRQGKVIVFKTKKTLVSLAQAKIRAGQVAYIVHVTVGLALLSVPFYLLLLLLNPAL